VSKFLFVVITYLLDTKVNSIKLSILPIILELMMKNAKAKNSR